MRKIYLSLFTFLLFFILFLSAASSVRQLMAQDVGSGSSQQKSIIFPPPPSESPPMFLGQDHYYTVTLRGNGEAIVALKVVLANLTDKNSSLSSVLLSSDIDPKDVAVYQVIREPQCIRYAPLDEVSSTTNSKKILRKQPVCEEYQQPDYYQQWYGGRATYKEAQYSLQQGKLMILLPDPVAYNASGSFFVYYRTNEYTRKGFLGGYDFSFSSWKTNGKIHLIQMGIVTDSDLFLKGATGTVAYNPPVQPDTLRFSGGVGEVRNAQFDQFYESIGQGSLVKTATNLAANEKYTVNGTYASSTLGLYGKEIGYGALFAAILLVFFGVLVRFFLLRKGKAPSHFVSFLQVMGISFVSSSLAALFTGFLVFVFQVIFSQTLYQGGQMIIVLIFAVISFAVYGFLLFAPALFLSLKKGVFFGIAVFGLTIAWIFLYLTIFLLFFVLTNKETPYRVFPAGAEQMGSEPSVSTDSPVSE